MAETIRLEELLGEVGRAVLDAQARLRKDTEELPPDSEGLRTGLSISETDIEVKMLFEEKEAGAIVRPVSAGKSRLAELDPGAFSTLRARLVAVAEDESAPPVRKPSEVRDEVLARPDLKRLVKIFGELKVDATYVSAVRRWVVDVTEPGGETVRSLQVPDAGPR